MLDCQKYHHKDEGRGTCISCSKLCKSKKPARKRICNHAPECKDYMKTWTPTPPAINTTAVPQSSNFSTSAGLTRRLPPRNIVQSSQPSDAIIAASVIGGVLALALLIFLFIKRKKIAKKFGRCRKQEDVEGHKGGYVEVVHMDELPRQGRNPAEQTPTVEAQQDLSPHESRDSGFVQREPNGSIASAEILAEQPHSARFPAGEEQQTLVKQYDTSDSAPKRPVSCID